MIDQVTGWWFAPSSIKVIAIDDRGRVLLCRNDAGDWELPGGWPDPDERTLAAVARREVREETGLDVDDLQLVGAELFADDNHGPVVLVFFRATVSASSPVVSHEHAAADFFALNALPSPLPQVYRDAISHL